MGSQDSFGILVGRSFPATEFLVLVWTSRSQTDRSKVGLSVQKRCFRLGVLQPHESNCNTPCSPVAEGCRRARELRGLAAAIRRCAGSCDKSRGAENVVHLGDGLEGKVVSRSRSVSRVKSLILAERFEILVGSALVAYFATAMTLDSVDRDGWRGRVNCGWGVRLVV